MGAKLKTPKVTFNCILCGTQNTKYYNTTYSYKFCNPTCYKIWKKENPQENYFHKYPRTGELNGNYGRHPNHIKAWGNMKELSKLGRMAQTNRKPTKPELHLYKLLDDASIKYEKQKWIGIYQIDAFIEPNLAIEVDGEYWHNLPHRIKSDQNKNEFLKSQNIEIKRFWSKDILKMKSIEGAI